MIAKTLILLGACLLPLASSVLISECSYYSGVLPTGIRSENCEGDTCQFSISSNVVFELDATVAFDTESLNTYVHFYDGDDDSIMTGIELPEESFGCNGLTVGSCPLSANTAVTWRVDWAWDPELVSVGDLKTVQVAVYDDNENAVSCFKMPVEIVA